ncbi:ABC transporter ATP-binding protein [Radicibacter daui]|uniref:ABC transporter ATP-binding protein n=1 Tax=Radicibacter daui TaxID=3064829 RepID=UPI004046C0AD
MPTRQDILVELERLSLTFEAGGAPVTALDNVSLKVADGEFVALIGPSGCGKSSILRLVAGLQKPSSGFLFLGGREQAANALSVGLAFQNPTMLPWLTIERNIMLPLKVVPPFRQQYRRERTRSFRDKVHEMLRLVGLEQFASHFPWQLSGGMLQRANLCRALIHEPQLLLLDEPFGALDQFTREELWGVMQNIWQARRPTVLLVTHDLREAAFLAERTIVMSPRPGRIISDMQVPLARPRTSEQSYSVEAVEFCQHLRRLISDPATETGR